ncbi:MAG: SGNH/GDSL hydrolase family protein [Desulfomonilaceae bacterium]
MIAKTDFIPKLKGKIGLSAPLDPHYQSMIKYHKWMDGNIPDNSVVFLGDSITQGLAVAAVAPYSINYGIGGETTAQLLDAVPYYKSLRRAKTLVLAIGINDIAQGKQNGLNERYKRIIAAIPHEVPLIWSSVMPVKVARWMKMNESDVSDANRTIKSLCERRGNCVFVDTHKFLTDSNNQIILRYFLDDGVHLSPEGYRQWIAALKEAMRNSY